MTQQSQPPTEVLGALPHRRPSRRSQKRGASAPHTTRPQPSPPHSDDPQPSPPQGDHPQPSRPRGREIAATIVQAAAELAEIGLSVSARALKEAVTRLPRP